MNGEASVVGLNWRSFKLTQVLQSAFADPSHSLVVAAHTYGHKPKIQDTIVRCSILWH